MANKNQTFNDLADEIEQYGKDIARELAIYTRERFYKTANKAITAFYNHYSPIYYHRHRSPNPKDGKWGYNIRQSIRKYYLNPHYGTKYTGGIEISPDWMDDIYRANTDYIFNLIYAGYHGNVLMLPWEDPERPPYGTLVNIPPIMNPSPLELILKDKDNTVKDINRIANRIALKVKKANDYQFIK